MLQQGNILNVWRLLSLRENVLESTSYLLQFSVEPVLMNVIKTFTRTKSHLFALLCHLG
jgi:hypothetical protein